MDRGRRGVIEEVRTPDDARGEGTSSEAEMHAVSLALWLSRKRR